MELFDTIKTRRSTREYLPEMVKKEDIITVLTAADSAPSAMNHKPWEFIVVTGSRILDMGASFGKIFEKLTKNWDSGKAGGDVKPDDLIRFGRTYGGAPVVIVVLTERTDVPNYRKAYLESASAAMENLLLAATALGLGTCWVTGPLEDETSLRRILPIPGTKEIVAITPLGYPAKKPEIREPPAEEVLKKIRWVG